MYRRAFHDLGYGFAYRVYPLARASAVASEGLADGEPQRIRNYAKDKPQLLRVEEPIFINRVMAYTCNPDLRLKGWKDLKGSKLRVEYLNGSKNSAERLQALVPGSQLSYVSTVEQALRKLIAGRADVFIDLESRV